MTDQCEVCHKDVADHPDGLKCCPMCGPRQRGDLILNTKAWGWGAMECTICGCVGPWGNDAAVARYRWNTRAARTQWTRVEDQAVPADGNTYLLYIPSEDGDDMLLGDPRFGVHLPWDTWRDCDDEENKAYAMKLFHAATHWTIIPKPGGQ